MDINILPYKAPATEPCYHNQFLTTKDYFRMQQQIASVTGTLDLDCLNYEFHRTPISSRSGCNNSPFVPISVSVQKTKAWSKPNNSPFLLTSNSVGKQIIENFTQIRGTHFKLFKRHPQKNP